MKNQLIIVLLLSCIMAYGQDMHKNYVDTNKSLESISNKYKNGQQISSNELKSVKSKFEKLRNYNSTLKKYNLANFKSKAYDYKGWFLLAPKPVLVVKDTKSKSYKKGKTPTLKQYNSKVKEFNAQWNTLSDLIKKANNKSIIANNDKKLDKKKQQTDAEYKADQKRAEANYSERQAEIEKEKVQHAKDKGNLGNTSPRRRSSSGTPWLMIGIFIAIFAIIVFAIIRRRGQSSGSIDTTDNTDYPLPPNRFHDPFYAPDEYGSLRLWDSERDYYGHHGSYYDPMNEMLSVDGRMIDSMHLRDYYQGNMHFADGYRFHVDNSYIERHFAAQIGYMQQAAEQHYQADMHEAEANRLENEQEELEMENENLDTENEILEDEKVDEDEDILDESAFDESEDAGDFNYIDDDEDKPTA